MRLLQLIVVLFLSLFISTPFESFGQNIPVPNKKVKGTYDCSLDKFLQELIRKNNVKIKYNPAEIEGLKMKQMFLGQDLSSVLDMIAKEYKLKFIIDSDTTIVFSSASLGSDYVMASQEKTYSGPPKEANITVAGIVRDKESGEALPYATVTVKGTNRGVVTNADGFFTIPKVPSDTNTLLVSYLGYQVGKICLTPDMSKSNVYIELLPLLQQVDETVIESQREDVFKIPHEISTINLNPRALATLPNIGEKDIMRSLQLMPGVSASFESSSSLYVRGGTPDQNLVMYDGFTVYQVDHLYGFYSAFNSNALKDVQLYKGGFGSKYGGRLSSVCEITGKDGSNKRFNMGGDLSLLSANVFAEGPIGKKWTFLVAGRKSYKGPLYNKIFNQFNNSQSTSNPNNGGGFGGGGGGGGGGRGRQGSSNTVSSFFYDLNTKVSFKPNKKDILTLSVYNGTDKLDNSSKSGSSGGTRSFSASVTDLTRYGNIGSSFRWARKWSDKFYSNTLISYSNYYSTRNRSNQGSFTATNGTTKTFQSGILENNNLKDYSFKTDHEWDIQKNHKIGFGLNSTYYDIAYTYSQNDTMTILDRHTYGVLTTGYVQDKIKMFGGKMTVTPGIRTSYFNVTNQYYYEPRFAANFNVTEKLMLKAATGKYYQMANRITREDILAGSKDFWVLSDGNKVPVSSSIHYIAGLSYETKDYLFSMEGYYKQMSDLTEYSIRFNNSRDGVNYNESFYHGSAIARGIEWMAQKKYGKISGWVCYTLGKVDNNYPIYSATAYPGATDIRDEFKIVGIYKVKRWSFSSTFIYATGRPYTAPYGGYQVTLLNGNTNDYIAVGAKDAYRLPSYNRMDVAINYNLYAKVGDDEESETEREFGYISLSIFNCYNHTNIWYYNYQVIDNQVISNAVTYLGITPNLTLSLKLR